MIFFILITLVTSTRVCLELLMVMALLLFFFQMENILLNDQGNALLQLLMIHF